MLLETLVLVTKLFSAQSTLISERYILQNQDRNPAAYAQASKKETCPTAEEIFENEPRLSQMTSKTSALYEAGTGQEFEVNFYKKGNFRRTGPNISQEAWIDMRDFEVFTVYEFDEQKKPRQKPTASGYFKEDMMLVLYDLVTKRGNKITKNVPDGYVEDSSCYVARSGIKQIKASQLIADVVERIAKNRHNKKYGGHSLKP